MLSFLLVVVFLHFSSVLCERYPVCSSVGCHHWLCLFGCPFRWGVGRLFVDQRRENCIGGGGRVFTGRIISYCGVVLGFICGYGAQTDREEILLWDIVIAERKVHVL